MIEIRTKLQMLGNSLGIIIPNELVKREGIREGDKVRVIIFKDSESSNL